MKNRTLLLVAATLFAITPMIAGASTKSENPTSQVNVDNTCGVYPDEIMQYMLQYGYHVDSMKSITGSCNVYAHTVEAKWFIVYIGADGITGFEEVNL